MNIIKQKISCYILNGDFLQAYHILYELPEKHLKDLLFDAGCNSGSITIYAFVCFLIQQNETVEWHTFASYLLNIAFCHIEGAYQSSFYHIKRAIELCPNDITLKESLLFFNAIPEKILSDEKAEKIAQEILKEKSTSTLLLE